MLNFKKKKINEDQKELKRKQYISNCCFNNGILSIYISSDKKLLLLIQLLGLKLFINLPLRPCNSGGSQMRLCFCGRLSNQHDGTGRCVVYWRMTMSFTSNRRCSAAGLAGRRAWRYLHDFYCPLLWVVGSTLPLLVQGPSDGVQEALQNQKAQKAVIQGEFCKAYFFSCSHLSEEPLGSKWEVQRTCQPCCYDKPCQEFGRNFGDPLSQSGITNQCLWHFDQVCEFISKLSWTT